MGYCIKNVGACIFVLMICSSLPAQAQCKNDMDCKGDRVCENGKCVSPGNATGAPQASSSTVQLGFGSSFSLGTSWIGSFSAGGESKSLSIADGAYLGIDLLLGLHLKFRSMDMLIGLGLRPNFYLADIDGTVGDVHIVRIRGTMPGASFLGYSLGIGMGFVAGVTVFSAQQSLDLIIHVSDSVSLVFSPIDLIEWAHGDGSAIILNSHLGMSMLF